MSMRHRLLPGIAAPAALLLLCRCGGGGGGSNPPAPPVSVSISGGSGPLTEGHSRTFTAAVLNATNTAVTWSIVESGGGAITTAGVYTAPATAGTFTIRATSQADSTRSATLPVQVVPAPGISTFQATPGLLFAGENSLLHAVFTDGTGSVSPGVGSVTSGTDIPVSPTATTRYTLVVTNPAGDTLSQDATVTCETRPPAIMGFAASPAVVPYGQPSLLAWTLGGGVPRQLALNGLPMPVEQTSLVVNPTRRLTYSLSVTNPLGTDNRTAQVVGQGLDTFAGSVTGGAGCEDGTGSEARLSAPYGMATDAQGNVFVADWNLHTIRKITPAGVVTTFAGSPGQAGSDDGVGSAARFRNPYGLYFMPDGTLFVSDLGNHTLRMLDGTGAAVGRVQTVSGLAGTPGCSDDGGLYRLARYNRPAGLVMDAAGNLYVADSGNFVIRKICSGVVTILAGSPGLSGSADGKGAAARFGGLNHLCIDAAGTLYVTDNDTVRRITQDGVVTTLAGAAGVPGFADGSGSSARFNKPSGIALDGSGNLLVADGANNTVRQVTPGGLVSTLAGSATAKGWRDGSASSALFNFVAGLARDASGNLYLGEGGNHLVRKLTPDGNVTTFVGKPLEPGTADGSALLARFTRPCAVAVDTNWNVYVADTDAHTIRRISAAGLVTTLAGSAGLSGASDGTGSAARFNYPYGLAVDAAGNVYVADTGNKTVRVITPAGVVSTLAGAAGASGYVDGAGSAARFGNPIGIVRDAAGNLIVADASNCCLRKITPAGLVSTFAGGGGLPGHLDGAGTSARFRRPYGLAIGPNGTLYVTDRDDFCIRKVLQDGTVSTVAGTPSVGGYVDGAAGSAKFGGGIDGIAVDPQGNLFVTDYSNLCIRKITPGGQVSTLAGTCPTLHSPSVGPLPGFMGNPDGIALYGKDLLVAEICGLLLITSPNGD